MIVGEGRIIVVIVMAHRCFPPTRVVVPSFLLAGMKLVIRPWEDETSSLSYTLVITSQPVTYWNGIYRDPLLEDQAELEDFNHHQLYAPFLWGKAVSPLGPPDLLRWGSKALYGLGPQSPQ